MALMKKYAFVSLAFIAFILISTASFAGKANYYYDLNNQLIIAELASGTVTGYYYDPVGNRKSTETATASDLDSDGDGPPDAGSSL